MDEFKMPNKFDLVEKFTFGDIRLHNLEYWYQNYAKSFHKYDSCLDASEWLATVKMSYTSDGSSFLIWNNHREKQNEANLNELKNKILNAARPSCFGRKDQTVYDENVRKAREITSDKIQFSTDINQNAELRKQISSFLCHDDFDLKFYKMAIYEKGGFFHIHTDSTHSVDHVATLLIGLPLFAFRDGLFSLYALPSSSSDRFEQTDIDFNKTSACIFYTHVPHKVHQVSDGLRIVLQYDVHLKPSLQSNQFEYKPVRFMNRFESKDFVFPFFWNFLDPCDVNDVYCEDTGEKSVEIDKSNIMLKKYKYDFSIMNHSFEELSASYPVSSNIRFDIDSLTGSIGTDSYRDYDDDKAKNKRLNHANKEIDNKKYRIETILKKDKKNYFVKWKDMNHESWLKQDEFFLDKDILDFYEGKISDDLAEIHATWKKLDASYFEFEKYVYAFIMNNSKGRNLAGSDYVLHELLKSYFVVELVECNLEYLWNFDSSYGVDLHEFCFLNRPFVSLNNRKVFFVGRSLAWQHTELKKFIENVGNEYQEAHEQYRACVILVHDFKDQRNQQKSMFLNSIQTNFECVEQKSNEFKDRVDHLKMLYWKLYEFNSFHSEDNLLWYLKFFSIKDGNTVLNEAFYNETNSEKFYDLIRDLIKCSSSNYYILDLIEQINMALKRGKKKFIFFICKIF